MKPVFQRTDGARPLLPMAVSLALVAIIGLVDYFTGFELFFFSFYLAPVAIGAWYVGRGFGMLVGMLCVAASIGGDITAGQHYSSRFAVAWNAVIESAFYSVVVVILSKLRSFYNQLEERVRQRTAALHNEIQERARLEEEILRISEREQRRIGHDLHDSLCQHLTATALAGQVLSEQLESPEKAEAARHVVGMVEEAIELTRKLARGLHPIALKGEGLMDALRELSVIVRQQFKIECRLGWEGPIKNVAPEDLIHFYRIAQEATTNAVRHSGATEIVIRLSSREGRLTLTVCDNGTGLPEKPPAGTGMGLRIMAHRASLIGAEFKAERKSPRGTCISCTLSIPKANELKSNETKLFKS